MGIECEICNGQHLTKDHQKATGASESKFIDLLVDEKILREYLWLHHGCSKSCVYGDDGEMQCNNSIHGAIDFKRDKAKDIIAKLTTY